MEVNRKERRNIALLILALVFACVSVILVGMLVGEVIGHINEKSCEVVGAGINQLAPPYAERVTTPDYRGLPEPSQGGSTTLHIRWDFLYWSFCRRYLRDRRSCRADTRQKFALTNFRG